MRRLAYIPLALLVLLTVPIGLVYLVAHVVFDALALLAEKLGNWIDHA